MYLFSQLASLLIVCMLTYFAMCVTTKEECVTDEEDEGQTNESPWQGKKGVICPGIPEEEQRMQERGVHDENGTCSYNYFFFFVCFSVLTFFVLLFLSHS